MYIIIPAYEPDKRLIQVVQDITIKLPKARIIVVNDGSGPDVYKRQPQPLPIRN